MLSQLITALIYLLLAFMRETISASLESVNGFRRASFNYSEGSSTHTYSAHTDSNNIHYYSNQTGITLDCPLRVSSNTIKWIISDSSSLSENLFNGRPAVKVDKLLEPLANGSLRFAPFAASAYRHDVHNVLAYCSSQTTLGTQISSPTQVKAVMDQHYEISVYDEYAIKGCTAVLKCHIPAHIRPFVTVLSWIKDSAYEIVGHGVKYSVYPSGEFHIRDVEPSDAFAGYQCKVRYDLTNQTRISTQGSLVVSDPSNNVMPKIIDCRTAIRADESSNFAEIPCVAQAFPIAAYSWYKVSKLKGLPNALEKLDNYEHSKESLIIRNQRFADSNKYVCVASNAMGETKCETDFVVRSPLRVSVAPKKLVLHENQRAEINCSAHRHLSNPTLLWLHNGRPISSHDQRRHVQSLSGQSILVINAVANSDHGIWQCVALNAGGDSAIDSTQLIIEELRPYFIELFDDQNVNIGDKLSLKCAAVGHPIPIIMWSLDGQPVAKRKQQEYTLENAIWGDYVSKTNAIVSYINITISSVFDGGVYGCGAENSAGINHHSAMIRVSGLTKIRQMDNRNVTAMQSITFDCPVVGSEPQLIEWKKDDKKLPLYHRHRIYPNGSLEIIQLDKNMDSGIYACLAIGRKSNDIVKQSFLLQVKVPPVIENFSFDSKLQAGMRTRIYCNIAEGDQPVKIRFFKDNLYINNNNNNIGVSVQIVDQYSISLAIENLSSVHNGNYSCIASNDAATVSYSANLLVNEPPKWIVEPKNAHSIVGNSVKIDCSADGFPVVQITWKKVANLYDRDSDSKSIMSSAVDQQYILIRSGPKYQVFENGTLRIANTDVHDSGGYMCQASNGVGPGVSTLIRLEVHIPAHFDTKVDTTHARLSHSALLVCEVRGDNPISIAWTKKSDPLVMTSNSKYSIETHSNQKGVVSKLEIRLTDRNDSGLYMCSGANAYGSDLKTFDLLVQEPPEPPDQLAITLRSSRTVALSWRKPYSGNDILLEYIVQYSTLSVANQSSRSSAKNVSVLANTTNTVLKGLHPSEQYLATVFAVNSVGKSGASTSVTFTTEEESPAGPPTEVRLSTIDAHSVQIDWMPPLAHLINGQLKGFYIGYRALSNHNTNDPFVYKTVHSKINADNAFSMILQGLRPYTLYSVIIQAFTSAGTGPRSDEMTVTTAESIPSSAPNNVTCVSYSSQSISVSWDSLRPEFINGILKGYRVHYRPTNNQDVIKNEVTSSQNKLTLFGLQVYTNYSISANGFTQIGDGPASNFIYCRTQEDIPSPPEAIKASVASNIDNSIFVSWKSPQRPNGILRKYTVYRKTSTDGEANSFNVPSHLTYHKAINLMPGKKYHFWVSAWTSVGESASSSIASVIIGSKVVARIVSFGNLVEKHAGDSFELQCLSLGIPVPNIEWKINGKTLANNFDGSDKTHILMNGSLKIANSTINDSANYSCHASNIHGSDSIVYELKIIRDSLTNWLPLSPVLEAISSTSASITIMWQSRGEEVYPIKAHEIFFKSKQSKEWKYYIITDEAIGRNNSFAIEHLECGTYYQIYMVNVNHYGKSSPSDILYVKTSGHEPISSSPDLFLRRVNGTSIKLNLGSWKDGGCPFTSYPLVQWRPQNTNNWNQLALDTFADSALLSELIATNKYEIKVLMRNTAGQTVTEYQVEPFSSANSIYHISGYTPEHIAVDNYKVMEESEIVPVLVTVIISIILLLSGLLSVYILYKAMQKRFNQSDSSLWRNAAAVQKDKNAKRGSQAMDVTNAELTSLTNSKSYEQNNCNVITTTSFDGDRDLDYKYVSVPKQAAIQSDYYSFVQKDKKCATSVKQQLSASSPNRFAVARDKQLEMKMLPTCEKCCNYLPLETAAAKSSAECPCCASCAVFDAECCSAANWQPICHFNAPNIANNYFQ